MSGSRQNQKRGDSAKFTQALLAVFLSSAAVGLALVGFIAVMRYVDPENTILIYANDHLFIALAGASAFYVILVGLMTWIILRFMNAG
jgi:hypothetical protein